MIIIRALAGHTGDGIRQSNPIVSQVPSAQHLSKIGLWQGSDISNRDPADWRSILMLMKNLRGHRDPARGVSKTQPKNAAKSQALTGAFYWPSKVSCWPGEHDEYDIICSWSGYKSDHRRRKFSFVPSSTSSPKPPTPINPLS